MLGELITAIVIFVSSCFLFYQTKLFTETSIAQIGPEYWPRILTIGMIALSLLLVIYIIVKPQNFKKETIKLPNPHNLWITMLLALVYTGIMKYIGFFIATVLFVLVMLLVLKIKKVRSLIIFSLGYALGMTLLFGNLMSVPLPRGEGLFHAISIFFY